MPKQLRLVDAANTHNPALIVLKEQGFELTLIPDEEDEFELGLWCAKKENVELLADDPLSLLGLAAILQHRGIEWRKDGDENARAAVVEATYGDGED
ncbi:MAG: hypothetical protein JXB07_09300 [Anaerolineae bacterium]|nr:hypothetical protein [Anaerolineae bacterium]